MSGIAVAIGGSALLGFAGSQMASGASQDIAEAQRNQAGFDRQIAMGFAYSTDEEMNAMNSQIEMASGAVKFYQQQMASVSALMQQISPVVANAFQQQLDLLGGKNPSYLSPLTKQLADQKQINDNQINAAMGGGGASSSAGIASNAKFAQTSAETQMNATQSALAALSGVANNGIAAQGALQGQAIQAGSFAQGLNQSVFGMRDTLQKRGIAASEGTSLTPYAGAGSVGSLYMGQATQQVGSNLMGVGTSMGIASIFGKRNSKVPGATSGLEDSAVEMA